MSNYPKYPPIKAPITPERAAAMKQQSLQYKGTDTGTILSSTTLREAQNIPKQAADEARRYEFKQWVLNNFYCPHVSDHFRMDKDGAYNRVVYNKRDSTKFSQVEDLWQAFKLGLRTDL